MRIFRILFFLSVCCVVYSLKAEPWLANRFSQNCAACHSPGRTNVPPSERRCTLSCQGCHVNPNGGGLRNLYGKWNEERWLNSFRPSDWRLSKPKPAAMEEQPYLAEKVAQYLNGLGNRAEPARVQILERGMKMATTTAEIDEKKTFNKFNSAREKVIEPDRDRWLLSIPEGDPQRETISRNVIGGGDLRYFKINDKSTVGTTTTTYDWSIPMVADIGVQAKLTRRFSMVIEARFMNGPVGADSRSEWDNLFEHVSSPSEAMARSAYLMVDDLPYNSYILYGLFRPMYGNYDPDHTNLFNTITFGRNASMRTVFKGFSMGTAPNVPFLNIHLVQPTTQNVSLNKGVIINAGARFVTLGASIVASYWTTTSTSTTTVEAGRRMTSLSLGGMLGPWVMNFDANRVLRDRNDAGMDAGTVLAMQNKIKLWRENYMVLNYFNANTADDLSLGSSTEMQGGFRSFLISGLDIELLASQFKNSTATTESNGNRMQLQLHLFF